MADRAGTRVAPEYQRKGLTSMLSDRMGCIADQEGRRLFVCVRPAAIAMCEKNGYKELGRCEVDLGLYGGEGADVSKVFVREPRGLFST